MIEVLVSVLELSKIKHDMLHSTAMLEHLRAAGIPMRGTLHMRGVERGVLEWTNTVDPLNDDEMWRIRWFDDGEPHIAHNAEVGSEWIREAKGSGEAYSWKRYRHVNAPIKQPSEDEL